LQVEEFKAEVKNILAADIGYDGHVKAVITHLPEDKQKIILNWIRKCKEGEVRPEPRRNNLLAFIYKSNDNSVRGILTKEKNSYFVELFLDKHKYYDRKRKYLGL